MNIDFMFSPSKTLFGIIFGICAISSILFGITFLNELKIESEARAPEHTSMPPGTKLASMLSPDDRVNVMTCVDRTCRLVLLSEEGNKVFSDNFGVAVEFKDTPNHYALIDLSGQFYEFSATDDQNVITYGNYRVRKEKADAVPGLENTL